MQLGLVKTLNCDSNTWLIKLLIRYPKSKKMKNPKNFKLNLLFQAILLSEICTFIESDGYTDKQIDT